MKVYKYTRVYHDIVIEYGVVEGNNTVFFIKPGQDGSLLGYNNKYYNIGKMLHEKYGFTIVLSTNPYDFKNDPLEDGISFIKDYMQSIGISSYQIYYFGNSNGGMIGGRWGYKYPSIKRMFLINTPLIMNCHKILHGLDNFQGEKIVMLYGSLDPSFVFVRMLDLVKNDKLSYLIIEGEDHNFSSGNTDFICYIEKYLL